MSSSSSPSTLAAASSMASGRPSTRRQIAPDALDRAVGVERVVRPGAGSLLEQANGRARGDLGHARLAICHRQGREPVGQLVHDPQRLAARREHMQSRESSRQALDEIGHRRHHVFAVVEHQQHIAIGQPVDQRILVGLAARPLHAQLRRHFAGDELGGSQRREPDHDHTVGESLPPTLLRRPAPARSCPRRQARSASSAGPRRRPQRPRRSRGPVPPADASGRWRSEGSSAGGVPAHPPWAAAGYHARSLSSLLRLSNGWGGIATITHMGISNGCLHVRNSRTRGCRSLHERWRSVHRTRSPDRTSGSTSIMPTSGLCRPRLRSPGQGGCRAGGRHNQSASRKASRVSGGR